MASVVISDIKQIASFDATGISSTSKILTGKEHHSEIIDMGHFSKLSSHSFPISKINPIETYSKMVSILPFRVKFVNVGIASNYGPGNAAPIGIAVIGINNYVM